MFHLPSTKFQHMHQDAQGVFWLATEDAGLIRWNKATGEVDQFNKSHGFLTNNIYSVFEDDFENLWLSSFNGIIRFQKESKNFTIFNEEDGISDNEFNRISHFQSEDGQIYFGTQNGITSFHPKDFQTKEALKDEFKLALNHTSIFGLNATKDQMADGSQIDLMNLGSGIRVIDFEITSPNMFWTDKIDLYYTLTPIGEYKKVLPAYKEKISSDNHVELFGMHPGTYELKVKALQKNGKQLGETMIIPMKIRKPIFHTATFWIFVFLGTVLSIWGLIRLRTMHLKRKQEELEKLVKERTEQIFNDQKIIQTQTEQIEAMKERLDRKDELWIEQFQMIVNKRLNDPDLYLPDIIDEMKISRSIFYEKVKSLTQMTPNQYIQELRLNKAKEMLEVGNVKTVKEVAFSIGMKRPSYFSKLYKERFGILPSAYFNSHKN
ncbi:MAG: helix-turn-helix domain-containing protein [Saprospiraceae bacterium]